MAIFYVVNQSLYEYEVNEYQVPNEYETEDIILFL